MSYYLGLLSGTSMDGVDAAVVEFEHERWRLIEHHETAYPRDVHAQLERLVTGESAGTVSELAHLHVRIGGAFAGAAHATLQAAGLKNTDISAIGSHGQTVAHHPDFTPACTLQLGDPSVLAYRTGCTVVADFRAKDIAAGGQGAPLAPAFHFYGFADNREPHAIVNIGGIANVTVIKDRDPLNVTAFDTGPGNTLLDQWYQQHRSGFYDSEGAWAANGRVHTELLAKCLADPYFQQPAPKSTGREYFNLTWLKRQLPSRQILDPVDVQATLLELSAKSIVTAVNQQTRCQSLFVCGGGAFNAALMMALARNFSPGRVETTAALGLQPNAVEAVAFAWLARRRMHNHAGNLPQVTGAARAVTLGGIYLPN